MLSFQVVVFCTLMVILSVLKNDEPICVLFPASNAQPDGFNSSSSDFCSVEKDNMTHFGAFFTGIKGSTFVDNLKRENLIAATGHA